MKKINIIISLLLLFLLTGCQKEYSLIIDDNKIVEEFNATFPDNEENNERIMLNFFPIHADNDEIYNKKISKEDGMIKLHLDYTYEPKSFSNSNLVNECFVDKKVIVDNEKYYYFELKQFTDCITDHNVDINIITDNKVLSNNADKVKGNKYIWHLTEDNKDNFNLEIKIAKGVKKGNFIKIFGIVVAIILVALLSVKHFLLNRKKANNI